MELQVRLRARRVVPQKASPQRKGWFPAGQSVFAALLAAFTLCLVFVYFSTALRTISPAPALDDVKGWGVDDDDHQGLHLRTGDPTLEHILLQHSRSALDVQTQAGSLPVANALSQVRTGRHPIINTVAPQPPQDVADPSLVLPGTTRTAQQQANALQRVGSMQTRHAVDTETLSRVNHIAEGVLKAGRPIFGQATAGDKAKSTATSEEDAFVSDLQKAAMLAAAGVGGRSLTTTLKSADAAAVLEALRGRQGPDRVPDTVPHKVPEHKVPEHKVPDTVPHVVKLLRGFEAVGHVVDRDVATAAALRKGGLLTTSAGQGVGPGTVAGQNAATT